MKSVAALTLLLFVSSVSARADEGATEVAKSHLANLLAADFEKVEDSYAAEIRLLPGHEFLKDKYGAAEPGSRDKGASVTSEKLLAAMKKSMEGRPERPDDKVAAMLAALTYETLETETGDFAVNPSDRVNNEDGKLHFTIVEGDALIKVSPPGAGDFLLLQLREIEDKWRVVAEYLD